MKGDNKLNKLDVAILGVKMACKILNIPEPEVYFIEDDGINNNMIAGIFRHKEYEILFNEEWVKSSEWIEIVITAFHESRHAYQSYSIKENKNETKETLELWKSEFDSYMKVSGTNDLILDVDYLNQAIEIDAIRFTHYKIKELFEVNTFIPDEIKALICITK